MSRLVRNFIFLNIWALLALPGRLAADELADRIYAKAIRSSAWIIGKSASGAGCVIDGPHKLVITNFHIVSNEETVGVVFPEYVDKKLDNVREHYWKNSKKLSISGKVIHRDKIRDLALIQVDHLPDTAAAVGLANVLPNVGDTLFRIGSPAAAGECWKLTAGITSDLAQVTMRYANQQQVIAHAVYSSLPATSGHSGAAVLDDRGKLVGIHAAKENLHDRSVAIDVHDVQVFLQEGIAILVEKQK